MFNKRVSFQIDAKDNASAKFNQIKGSIHGINSAAGDATKGVSGFGSGVKSSMIGITAAIGAAVGALYTIKKAVQALVYVVKETTTAFITMENSMIGLGTVARAFNQDVDKTKQAARELAKDGLMSVSEASNSLKNLLGSGFNLDEAIKLMNGFKDSAAFNRQGTLEFGQAIEGATQGIKNQNSILVDNAGITKNLSVILDGMGYSIQDLGRVQTDANVRSALYNGLLKEMAVFQGDAARAADTLGGSLSQTQTTVFNFKALIGEQLAPVVKNINDQFRGWTESLMVTDENGIKRLSPDIEILMKQISDLSNKVINDIIKKGKDWIENMGGPQGILEKLKEIWKVVQTQVIPALKDMWTVISTLAKILATLFSWLAFVIDKLDKLKETTNTAMDKLGLLGKAMKTIAGMGEWLYNPLKALNTFIDTVKKAYEYVKKLFDKAGSKIDIDIDKKASGGSVSFGKPYIVGEQGPELFVPGQSGTIVPNDKLSSGGSTVFNFNFQGATITNEEELINKITNVLSRQLELAQKGLA